MADIVLSGALLAIVIVARIAYAASVPHTEGGWLQRLKAHGTSSLVGRGLVNATYWVITPIAKKLVEDGVSANAVTGASVVFGGAAGMALASGHFGVGAWLVASSALCDALDGLVARMSGTASSAGEALDSSVDRYNEFFCFTGLALYFRTNAWMLAIVLLALHGAFMVSFAEIKAANLRVVIPPGWMQRPDRASLLIAGAALTALAFGFGASPWPAFAPLLAALFIDGVGANAAAARRLLRVVAQLHAEATERSSISAGPAHSSQQSSRPPPLHMPQNDGVAQLQPN
jgi:CDP-diacylglycerol--glycerol-3-phosphate 3-phosphatidyltransferase